MFVKLNSSWDTRHRPQRIFDEQFDELFASEGNGYREIWRRPMRELLITWETGQ